MTTVFLNIWGAELAGEGALAGEAASVTTTTSTVNIVCRLSNTYRLEIRTHHSLAEVQNLNPE